MPDAPPRAPAPPFEPFADEAAVLRVGELTAENRVDRITLAGALDVTRDEAGLADARALKALLDATVAALDADARAGRLPRRIAIRRASSVANPFADAAADSAAASPGAPPNRRPPSPGR